MDPRYAAVWAQETGGLFEPCEDASDILLQQLCACIGHQELGALSIGSQAVTNHRVRSERLKRRLMDGQFAGLAELAAVHGHQGSPNIDMVQLECDDFAQAHAGRSEQPDERRIGS